MVPQEFERARLRRGCPGAFRARFLAALLTVTVWGGSTAWTTPARAEPSVEDVKAAGEQFNLGRTAFKEEEFAVAAEHFERADGLAPNPKVLLLAIEARMQADQVGRAAQLAEVAKRRYPGDPRFEVDSIIKRAEKEFARVDVTCSEPCNLVDGIRLVHGEASREWVLFLEEGAHSIRAGFGDRDETKDYTAQTGQSGTLEFGAEAAAPVAGAAESQASDAPEGYEPNGEAFGAEPLPDDGAPPSGDPEKKGLSPTWFWVGAGTTAALVGVSTWSAIDTVSNPGQDVVRDRCRGQGTECLEYQQGVQRQFRTNVLWGVTGGVAAATVVLFVLTDWGTGGAQEGDYSNQLAFTPWFLPSASDGLGAEGFGASAQGSF